MTDMSQAIAAAQRSKAPRDVVQTFLAFSGKDTVRQAAEALVAEDADYISLNFDNPELALIEPWAGSRKGRQVYIDTFSHVGTYWEVNDFQITDTLAEGELVAVFGQFTYTSVEVGHRFTSPFAVKARVVDGRITFFQFMEDTYASARSFRVSGSWEVHNNGRRINVG